MTRPATSKNLKTRLKKRKVPDDVMKTINEELEKLSVLEVQSAEYAVCRNYLDWLTIVPWGIYSGRTDGARPRSQIGEKSARRRPLWPRMISKSGFWNSSPSANSQAESKGASFVSSALLASARRASAKASRARLKRQFYRFSVGGMRDEAEIKGHRRTYIGAMPGKMIQALEIYPGDESCDHAR